MAKDENQLSYVPDGDKVKVYLGKKHIGHIIPTEGGYHYKPKGSKTAGDTFPTIQGVMRSLDWD